MSESYKVVCFSENTCS